MSRLHALYDLVTLPFTFAVNMAADLGDAFDRRARVRGVNGCECDPGPPPDALHPNGRCRCWGEGWCALCLRWAAEEDT
jgi:hypothetical protein